ncbi:MAG: kinase, partial [Alphaproteobacteria bacterium]
MDRNLGSAGDRVRRVLCIGSLLWDVVGTALEPMRPGDDRPGRIRRLPGGVAYNIAAALARAGLAPVLLSAVGADAEGRALLAAAEAAGIDTRHVLVSEAIRTDSYMAIEAGGSVLAALADAHGLEAMGARILA